ncbi:MAG: alpha/beta fold hydrolase [Phycisphaeraceae bacterium]|nr:alpha/beta fold hydrolase [Phycisphaeraceae bacterium]
MPDLGALPLSLRSRSRWLRLAGVPALAMAPEASTAASATSAIAAPTLLWMHGRTAHKEIDPGRFLRLTRAGIGVISLDLPGHGERLEERLATPGASLEVVERMVGEIDGVVGAAAAEGLIRRDHLAIGGFSAGGMATLVRLCRPHIFRAALVEATSGNWESLQRRDLHDPERLERMNPIAHLEGWRPIPLMILHAEHDEWVPVDAQRSFVKALEAHGVPRELIEFHTFGRTGAPAEHIGFGRFAVQAKDLGTDFLRRHLLNEASATGDGPRNSA